MKSKTVISILAACALLLSGYAHSGGSIASTPAIAETDAATDPNYDMDEYAPSLGDIAGEWIYEEQDAGITDQYVGRPVGRYSISADGTFTYTSDGSSFATGTIGIDYEEYPDGSKVPLFVFYDESGEPFMASYATVPEERTDGCLYIGQDGASRLVPADPAPNVYGSSALSDPSASSHRAEANIADLVGVWNEADALVSRTLTVNEDGTFKLEFRVGKAIVGTVKIEYEEHPDGSQTPWFLFYKEDGEMWEGFQKSDEEIMCDLYAGHTGEPHFVRAS